MYFWESESETDYYDPDVKEILDMIAPEKVSMNNYYSCDLV